MNIKDILAALGIKSSIVAGIIGAAWLIGITPVYADGKTIPQAFHDHFIKPTPMDLANNDKANIQKYYMGIEYQLDRHKERLKDIEEKHQNNSVKFQIEFEKWKTERDKLQNQFEYWQKRTRENQTKIEQLIAGA